MGGICPLFFDGAVCQFEELPRPDDKENLKKIYSYLDKIHNTTNKLFLNYQITNSNKCLHKKNLLSKFAGFLNFK